MKPVEVVNVVFIENTFNQAYLSNFTYSEDGLMVKRAGSGGWLWFPVLPDAGSVNSSDGWMMDPPAANNHLAAGRLSLEN